MEWLFLLIGLVVGSVATWLIARAQSRASLEAVRAEITAANKDALSIVSREIEDKNREIGKLRELFDAERVARASLESTLKETERRLEEQRQFIENSRKQLEDTFEALSKKALDGNAASFAERAVSIVKPLDEALKEYQKQARALEANLKTDYGQLGERLREVTDTTQSLRKATDNLGTALRNPQVRGRWGELTLRRVAEMSGMSEHCDFKEQVSVDTEEGRQRPDMIVHLPGGRQIVVDSKVSLVAYLAAVEAANESDRAEALKQHAQQVRQHVKRLSATSYWSQFDPTPDFVVMFIPGESFFAAAVDVDRALIEEAIDKNVILASPTTFMAVLRAIALVWRQEQVARSAEEIRRLGAELYQRVAKFTEHFSNVGKSLDKAVRSFNDAAGSMQDRLLPSARRFKELGVTAQEGIADVSQIEHTPRTVPVESSSGYDAAPNMDT